MQPSQALHRILMTRVSGDVPPLAFPPIVVRNRISSLCSLLQNQHSRSVSGAFKALHFVKVIYLYNLQTFTVTKLKPPKTLAASHRFKDRLSNNETEFASVLQVAIGCHVQHQYRKVVLRTTQPSTQAYVLKQTISGPQPSRPLTVLIREMLPIYPRGIPSDAIERLLKQRCECVLNYPRP